MPGHRNTKVKESRWDRIRKRSMFNTGKALKNETVKRFIEMDFIGKYNDEILRGQNDGKQQLNPLIVMEMRHENIKSRFKRYSNDATNAHEETHLSCRSHNIAVEEHYINNELNKLRSQLQKNHERSKRIQEKAEAKLGKEETLVESLTKASKCIENYYAAPVQAIEEFEKLCDSYESDEKLSNKFVDENGECGLVPNIEADGSYEITTIGKALSPDESVDQITTTTTTTEQTLSMTKSTSDFVETTRKVTVNGASEQICTHEATTTITNTLSIGMAIEQHIFTDKSINCKATTAPNEKAGFCTKNETTTTNIHAEICLMQDHDNLPRRYVHFDNESQELYSSSEGIDSVISDIAEEALMELNMEEEELQKSQREEADGENVTIVPQGADDLHENDADGVEGVNNFLIIQRMPLQQLPGRGEATNQPIELAAISEDTDEASSVSNHEQNLIIEQLFQSRAHTNVVLKRKYLLQWIHYTTIAKIERENCTRRNDRVQKINMFLDKIRKEKVRLTHTNPAEENKEQLEELKLQKTGTVQIKKKYQNKIKIQQDIIDLQKVKLERQERLIMELKLNKLSDEAKDARQEIKNQLKTVIRCGEAKTKAKAKCLQLIGGADLKEVRDEDDFTRLQGHRLLMPKFLENMQDRALERSIRHEQARQRRMQHEAEREAQKAAMEEAKRLEDEEAKRLRIEALKEKRRLEKQAKILKERERQEAVENRRKAQEFCRRLLLRRVGMEAFKRLLQRKREIKEKCLALRRNLLQRCYFNGWRSFYLQAREQKETKADNLHTKIMLRTCMRSWRCYVQDERSKWLVAVDWYDFKLTELVFVRWFGHVKRMRMIEDAKMHQAVSHHEWHLKWKVLDCWQRLSHILQLEKETEERRQRWRMKIWDLLPDYAPNRDDYA